MGTDSNVVAGFILALSLVTSACTMPVSDMETEIRESEVDSLGEAVIGGTPTFARPEVGGQGCTFTMLTSKLFLTAAHCVYGHAL